MSEKIKCCDVPDYQATVTADNMDKDGNRFYGQHYLCSSCGNEVVAVIYYIDEIDE